MSLNLPICHACNTTLSRKQRTSITENVTNPPYLGAQLKKCDLMGKFQLFEIFLTILYQFMVAKYFHKFYIFQKSYFKES